MFLFAPFFAAHALAAEEDFAPATQGSDSSEAFLTGSRFFDDAKVNGGVYFFRRYRTRYNTDAEAYKTNLNHASLQANAEFSSGFMGNVLGFDFGVFASHDVLNKGAVDHEMGFVPWANPWKPDWSRTDTSDGFSIYRAAAKAKASPFWAKLGYYQPSGPGVLGVNWSFMPGTYRGFNGGFESKGFSFAFAWADQYKSPWYTDMHYFYQNDGKKHVSWMWSLGARYEFDMGLTVEAAYGASKNHLKNAHLKTRYQTALSDGSLTFGYHLYAMDDSDDSGKSVNDNFEGTAFQHYLFTWLTHNAWTFKLEGTYTRSPAKNEYQQGQFAYRLTDRSGSSKGAYDVWWNARSDWNADNEKALFFTVERTLNDVLPVSGFYAGVGAGIGFDGKAYGTASHFKEWAFTADIGYIHPSGLLEGSFVKLHYTEYRNGTDKPSWEPFKNGFQSEHDIILQAGLIF